MAIISLPGLIPVATFLKVLSETLTENMTDSSDEMLREPLSKTLTEEIE